VVERKDVTAPETEHEVVGEEKDGWYNKPVTVNLSADDYEFGSGVGVTYYSLNGAAQQNGTTTKIEKDGKHVLQYWSIDKAGNIETKKSVSINLDQTGPEINYSVKDGAEFGVDQQVTVKCEALDPLSGIATSTCKDVSAPAYELGLGNHSFIAEAADKAGNESSKSIRITVFVSYDNLGNLTEQFLTEAGGNTDIVTSLKTKLVAAKASEEKGNKVARNGQMQAFINEVKAKGEKDFKEKQVQILVELAESLMK